MHRGLFIMQEFTIIKKNCHCTFFFDSALLLPIFVMEL